MKTTISIDQGLNLCNGFLISFKNWVFKSVHEVEPSPNKTDIKCPSFKYASMVAGDQNSNYDLGKILKCIIYQHGIILYKVHTYYTTILHFFCKCVFLS